MSIDVIEQFFTLHCSAETATSNTKLLIAVSAEQYGLVVV